MVSCFTCGKPNASFQDRKVIFVLMRYVMFCKDDFKAVVKDIEDVLKARPKSREIIDRLFAEAGAGDSAN